MINIDYTTVSLVLSLLYLIVALVFFVLQKIIKWEQGITIWAIGFVIGFVGFVSIFLTPVYGSYAQIVGTFSTLTSMCFLLEGVLRFRNIGNQHMRIRFAVFIIAGFFIIAYFTKGNGSIRYLLHDSLILIMCSMSAYFFLKGIKGTERLLSYLFSCAFVFEGIWVATRWIMTLLGNFGNDAFPVHPIIGTLFLVSIVWILLYVFSVLLIISYRAQLRIQDTSERDALTGLYNRRKLDSNLKSLVDRNRIYEENFAVYLLDVNGFKMVNDTYGHAFGDMLLVELAKKIQMITRVDDFACRFGGDEFIIILRLAGGEAEANKARDRIRAVIEEPFESGNYMVSLKTAIGFVIMEDSEITLDEILRNADKNMYCEKKSNYKLTKVTKQS